jgi:hypothetical protein
MSRRYYKNRGNAFGLLFALILIGCLMLYSKPGLLRIIIIVLAILLVFIIIAYLGYRFYKHKKQTLDSDSDLSQKENTSDITNADVVDVEPVKTVSYKSKELMTEVEKSFFHKLSRLIGEGYIIQPQVNLATIIKKESEIPYQNELYRNIDFGIFKKESYKLLLLIELNDNSHNSYKRVQRDKKVKEICTEAEIPLITFWLNMPNTDEYVLNRVSSYLTKSDQELSSKDISE